MKFSMCVFLSLAHMHNHNLIVVTVSPVTTAKREVCVCCFFSSLQYLGIVFHCKGSISVFLCVTYAERYICSTCSNNTFILQNYIDSSVGKSVSNCPSSALCMVVTSACSHGFSFKCLCTVVNRPGQHQFGNKNTKKS